MTGPGEQGDVAALVRALAAGAMRENVALEFRAAEGGRVQTSTRAAWRDSTEVAGALVSSGIRPGDVIAAQLPVCHEHLLLLLAAQRVGAVFLPLLHIAREADLGAMLARSGAKLLVAPRLWQGRDFAEHIGRLPELPALQEIIWIGEAPQGDTPWHIFLRRSSQEAPARDLGADLLLFTSGTTGTPKGVVHSAAGIMAEVVNVRWAYDTRPMAGTFSCSVGGHVGAMLTLLRPFLLHNPTVYLDRWNTAVAIDAVENRPLEIGAGAPFFLSELLAAGRTGALSFYAVGGASVAPALIEAADRAGIAAFRSYGSTEHPTVTSGRVSDDLASRARTDGAALPGCVFRLVDDAGAEVPEGEAGEIVSHGPERFRHYLDATDTVAALTSDGWFRSGDIGKVRNGFLQVIDRKKDIIIRGGENIASKEVEDLLREIPGVVEAAVVPRPDPRLGERTAAFVVLVPGRRLDLDAVRTSFDARGVARQKAPEFLYVVDELPRNAAGKILKTDLRRRVAQADANQTETWT